MGHGDELMALGEAEAIHRLTGSRVLIVDQQGRPRWSPVWEHHPAIAASDKEPHRVELVNAPGARPYIKAWAEDAGGPMAVFSQWHAQNTLGHMVLTPAELAAGRELRAKVGRFVVVEPAVHGSSSPNKDWGHDRYQEVLRRLPGVRFVQFEAPDQPSRPLEGAVRVRTASFRAACGVLAAADAYLGPEGGLHHAAAALRVLGVVVFGSFTDPANTGYSFHANIFIRDQHAPCGRYAPCGACQQALERIKVEDVVAALQNVLAHRTAMLEGGCHHAS